MPMQLDPSIILNSDHDRIVLGQRELDQRKREGDARIAVDQQEAELRRQEILARREEIIQRALERNQPKEWDPGKANQALTYQQNVAKAVYGQLKKVEANPDTWVIARRNIGQLLGPEALTDLPEDVNEAMPSIKMHIASYPVEAEKAKETAPQLLEIPDETDPTKTVRKAVVLHEGDVFPTVPKSATSASNPTEVTLALEAAGGDAAKALAIIKAQRAKEGGGGGTSSAGLVDAVMANPGMFNTLTPTARTAISAELAKRGFDFEGHAKSAAPTGAQSKTLTFFNRAKQASEDLEGVEDQIAGMGTAKQAWNAAVPAALQSGASQLYTQSQRQFTEARLRKESGAAIPPQEFDNDRRMYFVQPGDTAATIEQKRRSRAILLASMANEAGPALGQFYGDDEGKSLIAGYRESAKPKASAASPKAAPTGVEQWERGTDGKLHKVTR